MTPREERPSIGATSTRRPISIASAKAKAFIRDLRFHSHLVGRQRDRPNNLLGSTWLITDLGYSARPLVAAFLLAIGLSASSNRRMLCSLAIGSVFLASIMLITPGVKCSMIYDAYWPFFALSYIALLKLWFPGGWLARPSCWQSAV